jgi:hypothetical protein
MQAHLNKISATAWLLLAIAITYPVVTIVLPIMFRVIVPEMVRSVLKLI